MREELCTWGRRLLPAEAESRGSCREVGLEPAACWLVALVPPGGGVEDSAVAQWVRTIGRWIGGPEVAFT
ncbi:hypothetical protein NDU88_000944 [Pleurodeles waltl]|uniref:Uncharacterized protein n=1 Tax=Pleurodeles waltl TaxID=8319 RepID=A0AAV7VY10_PLEWA|nr:hypothetical protein NDU88_000944 [Pleurodeles waltl]